MSVKKNVCFMDWAFEIFVGRWTQHKTMRIVDRKKNMYKVSFNHYFKWPLIEI